MHTELDRALPSVLFVNAVGMEAELLAGLATGFNLAGYNFVTWELRGSPGPSVGLEDCRLDTHVGDALALLAELEVRRLAIAGWCTGASVALMLGERLRERVTALLLLDGAYLFDGVPGGRLGNAMYAMCTEIVADSALAHRYHELTAPKGNEAAVLGLEGRPELLRRLLLPYSGGVDALLHYAHAIHSACDYDPVSLCRSITCPTMLIAATDDLMVSYRNSEKAARLITDSLLLLASRGGHYSVFANPLPLRQMVTFLNVVQSVA